MIYVQNDSTESVEIWASSFSIEIFHLTSKTYRISRLFVFFFSKYICVSFQVIWSNIFERWENVFTMSVKVLSGNILPT